MKILQITSVHSRYDTRIFTKQVRSLKRKFKVVDLLVMDGLGDETNEDVNIYDIGPRNENKVKRIILSPFKVFKYTFKSEYDVFHFHDPELLIVASFLSLFGKKVIFDFHESTHETILNKSFIPKLLRRPISYFYLFLEKKLTKHVIKNVVTATDYISDVLDQSINIETVNNFPLEGDISLIKKSNGYSNQNFLFVGNINSRRGIFELILAYQNSGIDGYLFIVGDFNDKLYEAQCKKIATSSKVKFMGALDRSGIKDLVEKCSVGVLPFLPGPNHDFALPNKLFEYMGWGLNILSTDLPRISKELKKIGNGKLCNVTNEEDFKDSILEISKQNNEEIGLKLSKIVWERYNWEIEFKKLLNVYNNLV